MGWLDRRLSRPRHLATVRRLCARDAMRRTWSVCVSNALYCIISSSPRTRAKDAPATRVTASSNVGDAHARATANGTATVRDRASRGTSFRLSVGVSRGRQNMYVSPVDGHVAGTTSVQSPERMSATYAAYASALVATTDDDDEDASADVLVASRSRNAPYVAVAASAGMVFARGAMPTALFHRGARTRTSRRRRIHLAW